MGQKIFHPIISIKTLETRLIFAEGCKFHSNTGIDNSFELERRFVRGREKVTARVGTALAVGHIKAGRPEKMRSLVLGCWGRSG